MESIIPANSRLLSMSSVQCKRCLKISIVVLFVVVILVTAYTALRAGDVQRSYFTVVLDCGSTGTRVNVYEWQRNITSKHDLPTLLNSFPDLSTKNPLHKDACHYQCMQTEPGLDKFVHNSSGIRAALEPLLIWAQQQIPSERLGDTSLFLLATAGLRNLPKEDAGWILENAAAVVREHPFVYRISSIRVLSGKEEAYYSWVALNYKLRFLDKSSNTPTLGVLDLGGSSLQVVMEIDESREDKHFMRSKIGPIEHQILAYSLPAFGLNEAFDRTIIILNEQQLLPRDTADVKFELSHPCLSSGFMQNYTCYGCFRSNGSSAKNLSGPPLSNSDGFPLVNLVGDPDWEQCKELARAAAIHSRSSDSLQLTADMNCKSLPSFNASHLSVARFHALSGFFAVYNVLNLNPRANLSKILEKGKELCSSSWADLKKSYKNINHAVQYCFRVPYLVSLIEEALCLGDAEILFGPGDVSWTLGAALIEGEYLLPSQTEPHAGMFSLKAEVISSHALYFVLVLCILFFVYCQVRRTPNLLLPKQGKKGHALGVALPSHVNQKTTKVVLG
ncbi:probable apyrase 7 isoform X2 [Macadamia integrifolia]|uniref:probable apyrase 7 isoform X2 n=1 Tax=Macadamia integrifolia TaxID=60698 RepID=UPI001C4FC693|nr:probable apyrase 7 isoform X2 [Macadamia integrifolia]